MSNLNSGVALERIDHGVLPSNDLGRAFRFWSTRALRQCLSLCR